jgi:transposase-like protein
MGTRKFWREVDKVVVKVMRDLALVVNGIPEKCKYCGSRKIVRFGHYQNVQRWWCKECKRKFVHNKALPKMKTPIIQIASALSMFYEGMSLNAIRRQLEQTYRNYPSDSNVYTWVVRFTKLAIKTIQDYKPSVGNLWIADETVLRIEGRNTWFWDIIDDKTRFLLASHISLTRTTRDAKTLVERAADRVGKAPEVIITDKLAAYLDGIELAFGADTKHLPAKRLTASPGTQLIERFHGTLKARTEIMRGLKKRESAKLITDGWLIHYNFFRPHESLKGKTPAQVAGIKLPYRHWLDLIEKVG